MKLVINLMFCYRLGHSFTRYLTGLIISVPRWEQKAIKSPNSLQKFSLF